MAYQKQTWENLPSTNTPVSAERLNHMEDGIYEAYEHGGGGETLPVGSEIDYDGNTVPTGWEQIDDVPVYSATETVCGTWIDGKPLYAKTFEATGPSGTSSSAVSLFNLPANTDKVWLDVGNSYWYNSSTIKPTLTLNWFYNTDDWCRVSIYTTDVRVRTGPNVNLTSFKYSITLKYTKTTD